MRKKELLQQIEELRAEVEQLKKDVIELQSRPIYYYWYPYHQLPQGGTYTIGIDFGANNALDSSATPEPC